MPAPFRIYSASAGSGKTYQLTKEYLKLALGYPQPADPTGERRFNPSYFKNILAITFSVDLRSLALSLGGTRLWPGGSASSMLARANVHRS